MDVRAMIGAALNRTFSCLSRFRAIFLFIALGLSLATTNVCPAGQSDCEMADMDAGVEMSAVCILACGVLLPVKRRSRPSSSAKLRRYSGRTIFQASGCSSSPSCVPRASLDETSDGKSNSSRRNTMKLLLTTAAFLVALGGAAFAASDCCGDLMACCAAMLDCCD